ncbi:MAG: 3-oxoacyl-ACP reductase family protein [Bryobacteraceae bacterium]|nr:3-oxoacyl-ACP reductase family protein [Bryobacteraceae bacterium]
MNRTALVTGGSRGIGRAIALELARQGCAVAVNYRERASEAAAVVAQIHSLGARAVAVQADVSVAGEAERLVQQTAESLGAIGILINNAGVLRRGDLLDFDYSQMEGMRAVNVDGLVRVTRAAAPQMMEKGWGRIVNITSIAAIGTTFAGNTFYAATKAAVITLTRRFALDLGPSGITVNAIAPGFIMTDMVGADPNSEESRKFVEGIAARSMMRRVGAPEDIASAVAFLVSERASFITAQVLTVDGGRMDYIAHP